LFRIVLYWHLDLPRRHSPLLLGHVLWGICSLCSGSGHRPPVLAVRSGTLCGAALSTRSGDSKRQVEIPRGAGSQLIAVDVCLWPLAEVGTGPIYVRKWLDTGHDKLQDNAIG
jgi:hypothetical protein